MLPMRFIISLLTLAIPSSVFADGYIVGINDTLKVQIAVWDELNATVNDMPGVSGEYRVDADGKITIPLAGVLDATERAPSEIAQSLETAIASYVGIGQSAKASVSLESYAPVYVGGQVHVPGVYDFTPGLTVQMALTLAGGDSVNDPIEGQERNFLSARGSINVLQRELMFLTAKRERLILEINGSDGVLNATDIDPDILAAENAILQSRKERYDFELASLARARASLQEATTVLKSKLETNRAQLEAGRAELRREEDLVERGLAPPNRTFERASYVNELESRLLDIERSVVLADQEMHELERDEGLLKASRNEENTDRLQEVEAAIAAIEAQLLGQYDLLSAAAGRLVGARSGDYLQESELLYTITRIRGENTTIVANKSSVLMPGDVVEITLVEPTLSLPSN